MKQVLIVFFGLFCLFAHAQQIPHMSQWANHQFAINPAHAGIKTCLETQGTLRGQWINLKGAPVSGWLTLSAPLNAKREEFLSARHGLGGTVVYDQLGGFSAISLMMTYAGHFNFTQDNRLSLGLSVGATQLAFDIEKAKPLDPDPVINGSAVELQPNANFGAWYNSKNYYIGLSLYQLIPQNWKKIGFNAGSSMHGMINGGFRMPVSDKWTLLPASYIGYAPRARLDIQLQVLADYRNRFTTGLGFRTGDALIAFLGYRFEERWRVLYSYDFIISPLRTNGVQSHELTVAFSPCKAVRADRQLCPLFE